MNHFEPLILKALAALIWQQHPRRSANNSQTVLARIATLRDEIEQDTEFANSWRKSGSVTGRKQATSVMQDIAQKEKEVEELEKKLVKAKTAKAHNEEIEHFLKTDVAKALGGDVEARKELHRLLKTIDFKLRATKDGDLQVIIEGSAPVTLARPKALMKGQRIGGRGGVPIPIPKVTMPQRGDTQRRDGVIFTYWDRGCWYDKDGNCHRQAANLRVKWRRENKYVPGEEYDIEGMKLRYLKAGQFEVA